MVRACILWLGATLVSPGILTSDLLLHSLTVIFCLSLYPVINLAGIPRHKDDLLSRPADPSAASPRARKAAVRRAKKQTQESVVSSLLQDAADSLPPLPADSTDPVQMALALIGRGKIAAAVICSSRSSRSQLIFIITFSVVTGRHWYFSRWWAGAPGSAGAADQS